MAVEEVHEVSLVSGATTFSRVIPADRLDNISNVTVLEIPPSGNQRNYQLADTQAEFTFEVIREANQQIIRLHFPPNNVSSTRFILRYFVTGSLRFYNEGDRFEWRPFGNSTPAPINSSNIVIRLPGQFTEAQVSRESTGLNQVNSSFSEGNKVTFNATNIPAGRELEISVIFPHGAVEGSASEWQTTSNLTPIFQWGSVILGVLMLCSSLAGVFGWWYLRIRASPDQLGKVPKYLDGPPAICLLL